MFSPDYTTALFSFSFSQEMMSAYDARGLYKNRLFRNSRPAGNNPKGSSEVIVGGIDSSQTVRGSGCGQTTCNMVEKKKKKKVKELKEAEEEGIPV